MSKKKIYPYPLGTYITYDAYYVKDKNSIRIETNLTYTDTQKGEITEAFAVDNNDNYTELDFGSDGIYKPLYRLVEKDGKGYVIGYTNLAIEEYLFSDYNVNYVGREYKYIGKWPSIKVPCLKVAYQMNKTRYVPISHIKEEPINGQING